MNRRSFFSKVLPLGILPVAMSQEPKREEWLERADVICPECFVQQVRLYDDPNGDILEHHTYSCSRTKRSGFVGSIGATRRLYTIK